jgi:hypothetical protein
MNKTDEALKLALEVLEQLQGGCTDHDDGTVEAITVWCPEVIDAIKQALAAPVQEPEYWNVLDPTGNVVASETDAIRGWARIAGSYKPTVEGLLGFHDQGWRVLPKVPPPAQPAVQEPFGYLEIDDIESQREYPNNCRNVNLWHEDGEGMVAIYTTPPEAQRQCTWPTCQSEEYQQALAEQINQELVTGAAQPAPDYAWPTVADYEKDVGFEVNEAFKMAWAMARTTNALFT